MAGTSMKLKVKDLHFDPVVQRPFDVVWMNQIIVDFDPDGLGTITANKRTDGKYYVVDGQHRVSALRSMDMQDFETDALAYEGLTLADEAALFRRLNHFKNVHPLDKFRIRVIEGEKVAVALNNMLQSRGWRVQAGAREGGFSAITVLEKLYTGTKRNETNLELVDTIVRIITEAWGHNAAGAKSEIISGLGKVFNRYKGQIDQPKLVAELSRSAGGPRALVGKARGLRDMRGGLVGDAMAEIFVTMLNRGRRNRLEPWRS